MLKEGVVEEAPKPRQGQDSLICHTQHLPSQYTELYKVASESSISSYLGPLHHIII